MKKINLKSLIKESRLGPSTGNAPEDGEHGGSQKFSTEAKKNFLEIVSTYNKYQEMMERKSDITKVAETLGAITEAACELAINEADDWFDAHTVKRNMNELKKLGSQFDKVAKEASNLDQRMAGLYEDMGHILSRYYKIGEITEDEMKSRLGMTNEGVNPNYFPGSFDTKDQHYVLIGKKNNFLVSDSPYSDVGRHYKVYDKQNNYLGTANSIKNGESGMKKIKLKKSIYSGVKSMGDLLKKIGE